MTCWLYQINAKEWWPSERYRTEVWEGQLVTNWTNGLAKRKPKDVNPGDIIILYLVKAGTDEPGIYGWGIITSFHKEEFIDFRPSPPSDYLKMNPVPEKEIIKVIREIRGGFDALSMYKMNDSQYKKLRQTIAEHVYGITS